MFFSSLLDWKQMRSLGAPVKHLHHTPHIMHMCTAFVIVPNASLLQIHVLVI